MQEKKYVQVCPKCGSDNIGSDMTSASMAIGVPSQTVCHNCGYVSLIFPEILESEKKKFKEELK